ncbi:helix-turn-helix domain-containing protein [Chitinophaga sp. MM2321]|uniref:helix-turn-helix transcriptional regulator n=1 Tax=Chitinophaga sp. MM2321 TaxID=3137178 RepID=UPI0032D5966E
MKSLTKALYIERDDHAYTPFGEIPASFKDELIPYAHCYFYSDAEGTILDQNIKTDGFSLWLHTINMQQGAELHPFAQYQVIALHVSDDIPVTLSEGGHVMLRHKEVNMFNVMPVEHSAILAEDHAISFHINVEPAALPRLAREFPVLQPLAAMPLCMVTEALNKVPLRLNAVGSLIKDRILNSKHIGKTAELFFRRNAADYFCNFARHLSAPAPIMMNQVQLRLLDDVFTYIVNNLHQAHTIQELCEKFPVNKAILQQPFEQEFHMPLAELIHQEKMALAFDKLANTDISISGIMQATGYVAQEPFMADFEKYYKCDPIQLRNAQ